MNNDQFDIEQQNIDQRRRYAEMLRMQNRQPQGQMVSGHYVAPSIFESFVPVANQLAGQYAEKNAMGEQAGLNKRKNQALVQGLKQYADTARGTPAETIAPITPMDDEGNAMPSAQREAVAGNPQLAAEGLISSPHPMLQEMGIKQLVAGLAPRQQKWEKVELPNPDGSKRVGFVDINAPNPITTFQSGGTAPTKLEGINTGGGTTFVNPYAPTSQGAPVINSTGNPFKDLVIADASGNISANRPLLDAKKQVAKAGAANTNVNVNTAPKKFYEEVGKGVGEAVTAGFEGAKSGAQTLNNVAQIREGLATAIVGPAANARVKLAQIGDVLGVGGKNNAEKLANTRAVMQGLARQEMAAAAGMKGQGQITESERGILRRAESGSIDELTVPEINALLGALEKTANARISLHEQNLQRLQSDPNAAGVAEYMQVNRPIAPSPQQPSGSGFRIVGQR